MYCRPAVLALAPGESNALKCRVIVLIQYDEFQQALDAIAGSSSVADDLLFEKAGMHAHLCIYGKLLIVFLLQQCYSRRHICTAGVLLLPAGAAGAGANGGAAGAH